MVYVEIVKLLVQIAFHVNQANFYQIINANNAIIHVEPVIQLVLMIVRLVGMDIMKIIKSVLIVRLNVKLVHL